VSGLEGAACTYNGYTHSMSVTFQKHIYILVYNGFGAYEGGERCAQGSGWET